MKIAVVGSREFYNKDFVIKTVRAIFEPGRLKNNVQYEGAHEFVSGGAIGVDSWAEEVVRSMACKCYIFKPDWTQYGKSAGFIRNKLIIDAADKVIAFWDGKSKGTKSSIDLAINAGKPVDVYIRTGVSGS